MKRETDTSAYVGYSCSVCGKPVRVSHGDGFWARDPKGKVIEAAHTTCKFPVRRVA